MVKSPKIGNVLNEHKSSSGRQLNAAARKSLELQASSLSKRRTLWNQKFVYIKVSVITRESRNSEEPIAS